MAIKAVGNPKTVTVGITASEALYGGRSYVYSGNLATLATTTDAPQLVSAGPSETLLAASAAYQEAIFYETEGQQFDLDVVDANFGTADACFNAVPSADGNSTGTTLIDASRTEAGDFWNGGSCAIEGLPGVNGENYQVRTITDFVSSNTTMTFSSPFLNSDGTAHKITDADIYHAVNFGMGDEAVEINSTGTGLAAEATLSGGAVKISGDVDFANASKNIASVRCRFNNA